MIQVIKHEYKKIDELVNYINNTSIKYGYLKDYEVIKENNKDIALINFEIPSEVCQLLELAKFDIAESEGNSIYGRIYNIIPEEKTEGFWLAMLSVNELRYGVQIQGTFGIKNICNLVEITYDKVTTFFKIEFNNYKNDGSWHKKIDKTLFIKEIDPKIVYKHVVKVLFNRGYLINKISLKNFENDLYYLAKLLNEKNFDY
jgi:hypothetical protein